MKFQIIAKLLFVISVFIQLPTQTLARGEQEIAGPKVGNGGGLWLCRDRESLNYKWIELTDLFEAKNEFGWELKEFKGQTFPEIYLSIVELARKNTKLGALISKYGVDPIQKLTFIHKYATLTSINDGFYKVRPSAASCSDGYIHYAQLANFTNDGVILVNSSLWAEPLLSSRDKAALLVHELVYKVLRDSRGDKNSLPTRAIVAALFSQLNEAELSRQIDFALSADYPDWDESKVNISLAYLTCGAQVSSKSSLVGKLLEENGGELVTALEQFEFSVSMDSSEGRPTKAEIVDSVSGATAQISGTELDFGFNAKRGFNLELKLKEANAKLTCWLESKP